MDGETQAAEKHKHDLQLCMVAKLSQMPESVKGKQNGRKITCGLDYNLLLKFLIYQRLIFHSLQRQHHVYANIYQKEGI